MKLCDIYVYNIYNMQFEMRQNDASRKVSKLRIEDFI